MSTLLFHGQVILPDRVLDEGAVACANGVITAVGKREQIAAPPDATVIDAQGGFVAAGYVDIHTHGGDGADFMDATPEAVVTAIRAHTRHGTTTIFPTTTTGTPAQLEQMLRACLVARKSWTVADGARIGGVHFYGPYFAENMVGAHPKGRSRFPDPEE